MPILINTPQREGAAAYLREAYPAGVPIAQLRATLARTYGFTWSASTVYTWAHQLGLKRPEVTHKKDVMWTPEIDQQLRDWAADGVKVEEQVRRLAALGTCRYIISEVSERRKALGLVTRRLVAWKARPEALEYVYGRYGMDDTGVVARQAAKLVGLPVSRKAITDAMAYRGVRVGENQGGLRIADAARQIGVTTKQAESVIKRLGIKRHGRHRRVALLTDADVASLAAYLADIVGTPTPGGPWVGKEVFTTVALRVHRSPWWTMLLPLRRTDRHATIARGAYVGRVIQQLGNALDIETAYGRVRLAAELAREVAPAAPLITIPLRMA